MSLDEGTDKHDEPDHIAADIAGAIAQSTTCVDCRTHVVAVPGIAQPRCLQCFRQAAGITWASGDVVGEWHPSGGGTAPESPTVVVETVELMCFWCDKTWSAPLRMTDGMVRMALDAHEQAEHPHTLVPKEGK